MALGVRGSNPIWLLDDLQSNLFDDTFYMFVLENTIPYIPAIVYHDPDLNTPWTNPIRFLGNGTLPVDIFFESDVVYRLEFRQGPTQADPLIYEVNNYMSGSGGSTPVDTFAFASSNQITNPQFSMINFGSPFSFSGTNPPPINIAPGWFLVLAGTGTFTLTQVPLNDSNINPSNSPYALQLTLNGWTTDSVFLVQRFYQNGMLWANKFVSSTITAKLTGAPQSISADLVDSNSTLLATVLPSTTVNEDWNEFTGHGELPTSTNPDVPPATYIDYKLALPSNIDIYVSSIQLVVEDLPIEASFEQDSIERQIDHTFHYFQPWINFKPINSFLTGWDFPLNPAQWGATQTVTTTPAYIWDQTIMASAVANVNITRNSGSDAMKATTTGADDAFYMLQYLQGAQAVETVLSELAVNILAYTLIHPGVVARVYLYNGNTASAIPATATSLGTMDNQGIFTLTAGANWTLIPQPNGNANTGTLQLASIVDIPLFGFNGSGAYYTAGTSNFAIVVTFKVPLSGTEVLISSISCVPGNIPTRPAPLTKTEVLNQCKYYWQKSFLPITVPVQNAGANSGESYGVQGNGGATANTGPIVRFPIEMRALPLPVLYNPIAANTEIANISGSSDWSSTSILNVQLNGFATIGIGNGGSAAGNLSGIHWTANARLGDV